MKLKIVRAKSDCCEGGYKNGDLLLVDTDYGWDPEKVLVLHALKRGGCPERSEYKNALEKVSEDEINTYLWDREETPPQSPGSGA